MASDPIFRHLMQELFSEFYVAAFGEMGSVIQDCTPKGALTKSLFELLVKVFDVLEYEIIRSWSEYFDTYLKSINSPKKFISYMIMISRMEIDVVNDHYDKFLIVLALINYATSMTYNQSNNEYFKLTSKVMTFIYEKSLREDFHRRGGWKHLKKHIINRKYVEYYNECKNRDLIINGQLPEDLERKIQDIFSPQRPSFSHLGPVESCGDFEVIDSLSSELMSSIETSLLDLLSSPATNTKESEGSNSSVSEADSCDLDVFYSEGRIKHIQDRLREIISIFESLEAELGN